MIRVLILGAGGHGQVVAEVLLQMQLAGKDIDVIGFLDDDPTLLGQTRSGISVLGNLADLSRIEHDAVIVAIGDNSVRHKIYCHMRELGEQFLTACHPQAVVATSASIGRGTVICAGAVISTGAQIGNNVILNTGCTVDHHNQISDHSHIAPGAHLGGDVKIGHGSMVGIGSVVLPQCTIGSWTIVGAGAVVTKTFPDEVVVIGVPARIIHTVNKHLVQEELYSLFPTHIWNGINAYSSD